MKEKIKEIKEKILNKIYAAIVENDSIKSPENIMYIAKTLKYLDEEPETKKVETETTEAVEVM